ncbi:hypothetical protein COB21_02145 [Candidatus Aerophobetes bacterium]|uniref:phospholipase D n=1 Tax=Aerophobetes bacterium TaxID=2030807 RepID=A0A2A4X5P9_UNCAE|nr:MAG: hypothetical protein COB21_02145 [Candidatus Aerophobetes bacterium]
MLKGKRFKAFSLTIALLFLLLFFLWVIYIPLPCPENPIVLYDSQAVSLRSPLITFIHGAKKRIHLSSFSFNDPLLANILMKKRVQGCDVVVGYDKRYKKKVERLFPQSSFLKPLSAKGLAHEKTALIDHTILFLSSSNLTLASSQVHRNITLGFFSPQLVSLWEEEVAEAKVNLGTSQVHFFRLPQAGTNALSTLISTLDQAKKSISVAMFTFTHQKIGESLIRAKNRGVDVTIFADKTCAKGASFSLLKKIEGCGIKIYRSKGEALLHHKWALIDHREFLFGSANWTNAAFLKNCDFIIKIDKLPKSDLLTLKKVIARLELVCEN